MDVQIFSRSHVYGFLKKTSQLNPIPKKKIFKLARIQSYPRNNNCIDIQSPFEHFTNVDCPYDKAPCV
jgi:hypothetical protein